MKVGFREGETADEAEEGKEVEEGKDKEEEEGEGEEEEEEEEEEGGAMKAAKATTKRVIRIPLHAWAYAFMLRIRS